MPWIEPVLWKETRPKVCASCRHWEPMEHWVDTYGTCETVTREPKPLVAVDDEWHVQGFPIFRAEFGCIKWEAKEEQK